MGTKKHNTKTPNRTNPNWAVNNTKSHQPKSSYKRIIFNSNAINWVCFCRCNNKRVCAVSVSITILRAATSYESTEVKTVPISPQPRFTSERLTSGLQQTEDHFFFFFGYKKSVQLKDHVTKLMVYYPKQNFIYLLLSLLLYYGGEVGCFFWFLSSVRTHARTNYIHSLVKKMPLNMFD